MSKSWNSRNVKKTSRVTLKMEAADLSETFVSPLSTKLHGVTPGSL